MEYELLPSSQFWCKGVKAYTNRWGMRDQEYTLAKPMGTIRIAILGASHEIGTGVEQDAVFESILERKLNDSAMVGRKAARYEILNFSVPGYTALQRLMILDKVLRFSPDVVLDFVHYSDGRRISRELLEAFGKGTEPPYPYLRELLNQARIAPSTVVTTALRRFRIHERELLHWVYGQIAERCRAAGARAVPVLLPNPDAPPDAKQAAPLQVLSEAGRAFIDLTGVYDGYERTSLWIAPFDRHPNAIAHRLIADQIYAEIRRRPELLDGTASGLQAAGR